MTELRFDGRVAVVTGAGRGVGRAHARLLAARGAAVVVNDLGSASAGGGSSSGPAASVVAEIVEAGGQAIASYDSVTTEAGAQAIVGAALEAFGRLDILVNNAGTIILKPFVEHTPEDFRSLIDVHLMGAVNMCHAAWGPMADAGYGRIVNTTSNAMLGQRLLAGYGAAKSSVKALTLGLAREGRASGIRVNAIAPAADSRMLQDNLEAFGARMAEEVHRMRPEQVAPMAAYLAHESCARTGEVYFAGGGEVYRFVTLRTAGLTSEDLTPEEVAEQIEAIADPSAGVEL